MRILSGVYWDKGGRRQNQDSVALQQMITRKGRVCLAVISDGIGGLQEGELASGYIIEKLIENLYGKLLALADRGRGRRLLQRCLQRCFYEINAELRRYGRTNNIQLGATVSLLFIWKRQYLIFHLGDSRIYCCKRKSMTQLTRDHSDRGGRLMKCIGSFPFQQPDIRFGKIHGKQGFLLCTDGFYRSFEATVSEVLQPKEILTESQIERRLRELAVLAGRKGEQDNLSAIYVVVG